MAGGQQTILRRINVTNVVSGDALYTQATGSGVLADAVEEGLVGSLTTIGGSHSLNMRQVNDFTSVGATVRTPLSAFVLDSRGTLTTIGPNDQLAAPPIGEPDLGGAVWDRIQGSAANIDWVGGIARPLVDGAGVNGAIKWIVNVGGGGTVINIIDKQHGGNIFLGQPSMALGFQESMGFVWDSIQQSWLFWGRGPIWYRNGGANNLGGRCITTHNATPTILMKMLRGDSTQTGGLGFSCDVAAIQLSTGFVDFFYDVKAAWDAQNTNVVNGGAGLPLIGTQNGSLGTGGLTLTGDATFNYLNAVGIEATDINWCCGNFRSLAGPLA